MIKQRNLKSTEPSWEFYLLLFSFTLEELKVYEGFYVLGCLIRKLNPQLHAKVYILVLLCQVVLDGEFLVSSFCHFLACVCNYVEQGGD